MKREVDQGRVSRIIRQVKKITLSDALGGMLLVAGTVSIAGGYPTKLAAGNEYDQAISAYVSGDVTNGNVLSTEADRDSNEFNRDVIVGIGFGVAGTVFMAKGVRGKLFR
jgi:hypothetical protein